jgi:hypothetical protein
MKLNVMRNKAYVLGASGLLALGAGAGIAAVTHPALAAPSVTTPDTGDTIEVGEGPETPGGQDTETPAPQETETPGPTGGHAEPAGANVDNQHQGQGESDG